MVGRPQGDAIVNGGWRVLQRLLGAVLMQCASHAVCCLCRKVDSVAIPTTCSYLLFLVLCCLAMLTIWFKRARARRPNGMSVKLLFSLEVDDR